MDFGVGVRGAERRHQQQIPRGSLALPRSPAVPGPSVCWLCCSWPFLPSAHRCLPAAPSGFEHVCREEQAWEGRALAFADLGRGPGAHFLGWACRAALPVSSLHGRGVCQMQTIKVTTSPDLRLPVRPRRPRQRITGQMGVQSGTLCVCTSEVAAPRQSWSQDSPGPLGGAEPRHVSHPGTSSHRAGERKKTQQSRCLPLTSPGGLRLRLRLSPHLLFFYL